MLQIYQTDLADLLRNPEDEPRELVIKEVGVNDKITVEGATELVVTDLLKPESEKQLIKIFGRGLDNRLMRSNDINETSSRSHLVFVFRTTKRHR